MTTTPSPFWQVPPRTDEQRLVGGVASSLAIEVGVDPTWIRLAFVLLFALGGWGALLYLVAWGVLALAHHRGHEPAGPAVPKALDAPRRLVGIGLITAGIAGYVANFGGLPVAVLWPVALIAAGIVVALGRLARPAGLPDWFPAPEILGGIVAAVGVVALVGGVGPGFGLNPVVVASAVLVGSLVLAAPWWWRLISDLDAERQARVRADERAEVAAHLHDSVLQTLTLIQKQLRDEGADPARVAALARRQERELRNWLDPDRASRTGGSVRGRLDDIASEVESLHGVPVEVVCVGDLLVSGAVEPLLAATREATMNAAAHSGADRIDVYAEIGIEQVEVFVRDTGCGFDPDVVDADRRGVRHSIVGRMERAGGRAEIHTEPGGGTEIELVVPRPADPTDDDPGRRVAAPAGRAAAGSTRDEEPPTP